jgi:hypothetical protein
VQLLDIVVHSAPLCNSAVLAENPLVDRPDLARRNSAIESCQPACRARSGLVDGGCLVIYRGTHSSWPAWICVLVSELTVMICWTTTLGSADGSAAAAIDHSVWPGRTTISRIPAYPPPPRPWSDA